MKVSLMGLGDQVRDPVAGIREDAKARGIDACGPR